MCASSCEKQTSSHFVRPCIDERGHLRFKCQDFDLSKAVTVFGLDGNL